MDGIHDVREQEAIITTDEITERYHQLLGGHIKEYDPKTSGRMFRFAKELCNRRTYNQFTTFDSTNDGMIIGSHLRLFSICKHHLLPFFGEVDIGYIPNGKIFGLSKLQRIVDAVASHPTLQEDITEDIIDVFKAIKPKGIGIRIRGVHTCVYARGVNSPSARFITTKMWGIFKDNIETRNEFLKLLDNNPLNL